MNEWKLKCPNNHNAIILIKDGYQQDLDIYGGCHFDPCEFSSFNKKIEKEFIGISLQIDDDANWDQRLNLNEIHIMEQMKIRNLFLANIDNGGFIFKGKGYKIKVTKEDVSIPFWNFCLKFYMKEDVSE